jgi:uncharacterized membrane protein
VEIQKDRHFTIDRKTVLLIVVVLFVIAVAFISALSGLSYLFGITETFWSSVIVGSLSAIVIGFFIAIITHDD